jgi:hypothetical protein
VRIVNEYEKADKSQQFQYVYSILYHVSFKTLTIYKSASPLYIYHLGGLGFYHHQQQGLRF